MQRNGEQLVDWLTAAEAKFCRWAVKPHVTLTYAYMRCFPDALQKTERTIHDAASKLAKKPACVEFMKRLRNRANAKGVMQLEECLLTLSQIARADVRNCVDDEGNLLPLSEIDDGTAIALTEFDMKTGKVKLEKKIEAASKLVGFHLARLAIPQQPTEGADLLSDPANQYDWARRIAYMLHKAAQQPQTINAISSAPSS